MYLESAKINYFKSIGGDNNVLDVERNTTALIGKNESGKSNVLEAIGMLDFLKPLSDSYIKMKTRGQDELPTVSLIFSFSDDDVKRFPSAMGKTTIVYDKSSVSISGGLSYLISQDSDLNANIDSLLNAIKTNEFKLNTSNLTNLKNQTAKLEAISQKIYYSIFSELETAKGIIKSSALEEKNKYLEMIEQIKSVIENYYFLLPQVYYRNKEDAFKDVYSFDDIKKLIETDCILHNLIIAAGIDKETLIKSFQNTTEADKKTCKKLVESKIKKLVDEFNDFYNQENITFDFDIEAQTIKLYVCTSDKYMSFSERSNGLKWYFSLFIDVKAKTNSDRPIIFLLDEPGVFLHVRAQKQIIELFSNLCKDGNQVIYTTHSPYMIDSNNVFNIRAVEKTDKGFSKVFKSIYNHQLSRKSKLETLSPLIEAFGMDLKYNIGPQHEVLNVVVEGVTDSMYFTAMLMYLGVETTNFPNIIPCAGVDNVNLVVSILIGWGCDYRVVLDYDKQGYSQYKKLVLKSMLSDNSKVFFVNLKTAESEKDVQKPNAFTTEFLVAPCDNDKLVNKYDGTDSTKALAAKEFLDKVSKKEITLSQDTVNAFKNLFLALGITL